MQRIPATGLKQPLKDSLITALALEMQRIPATGLKQRQAQKGPLTLEA